MQMLAPMETYGGAFYSMVNTKMLRRQSLHRPWELGARGPLYHRVRRRRHRPHRWHHPPRSNFRHASALSRRAAPEVVPIRFALEGVGNAGCPMHPQPPVQKKSTGVEAAGSPESPGIPARNGFNGFLRALPGDRAFLPPSSAGRTADLAPASGRQDHTTSPYVTSTIV
jgi:hypothetical protein